MRNCLFTLLLLFSTLLYAAKEQRPRWIYYPSTQTDTVLAEYLFKTEFKVKDSVEFAACRIAATGTYNLWVNELPIILHGTATNDTAHAAITILDLSPYLVVGKNAISICILPSAPYQNPNNSMWMSLEIDKETPIYSSKVFKTCRYLANHYSAHTVMGNTCLTIDYKPKDGIVDNWHLAGFNYKKFSHEPWLSAMEGAEFVPSPGSNTIVPTYFSKLKEVTNLTFPITIKASDQIVANLPKEKLVQVEFVVEGVKDKVIYFYTPEMKESGIKHRYTTTFGMQHFILPLPLRSEKLVFDFTNPIKVVGIYYRTMDE